MSVALLIARVALATVFAAAAAGKLADLGGSRRMLEQFGLTPRLGRVGGIALPVAELAVAFALLFVGTAWLAAVAAAALLLCFCIAIVRLLVRGETPDCNCFGSLGSSRVGRGTLLRNGVLLGLAGSIIVAGRESAGASAFAWAAANPTLTGVAGLVTVAIVVQGVFSWQLFKQNGRLLARVTALEESRPTDARDGERLAVGALAPAFVLPDLDGQVVSLGDVLASGEGSLLVFTDPGCAHCTPLLPAIAEAQSGGIDVPVTVISTGEAEANRPRAEEHGIGRMLLQEGFAVAEQYRIYGAPAAILIDPDGRISETRADGARAVRELLAAMGSTQTPPSESLGYRNAYLEVIGG